MQKLFFFLLLGLMTASSCSKSNDDNSSQDPQLADTKWKVTYYYDKDKDETGDFAGYTFELKADGTLLANMPGGGVQTGTWSGTGSKLIFSIAGSYALDAMNDDWLILEKNDTLIKLRDDNAEHLEELWLQKI